MVPIRHQRSRDSSNTRQLIGEVVKTTEEQLKRDPRVDRLLKNPNWRPAAEAAMAFLFRGKSCPIQSWRKSSTWAQVEMVLNEMEGNE